VDITSINSLNSLNSLLPQKTNSPVGSDTSSMFSDLYDQLIGNVNSTNEAFEGDIVKSAAGELDNPHQLEIDSTKANIALQLALNVRNNALEAYNEVIKMSV
jgi:flagellar hook-basal body complex protein FliE